MTLGKLLGHVGMGHNHLQDRFTHTEYGYGSPVAHDAHLFYDHEPPQNPTHIAAAAPKHHHQHSGGGHKSNAAMSALTLLAFLFFLHILQQCLKEHMTAMSTPQLVVMTAGREGEEHISKQIEAKSPDNGEQKNKMDDSNSKIENGKETFTKIRTAERRPQLGEGKYKNGFGNRNSFPGFVSAMGD